MSAILLIPITIIIARKIETIILFILKMSINLVQLSLNIS